MVRTLWILVAVAAGATCMLFLTLQPTVTVDGKPRACPPVLAPYEHDVVLDRVGPASPCRSVQTRWTWYAAGSGLACVVVATGVAFRQPRSDDKSADTRQKSIDNR